MTEIYDPIKLSRTLKIRVSKVSMQHNKHKFEVKTNFYVWNANDVKTYRLTPVTIYPVH